MVVFFPLKKELDLHTRDLKDLLDLINCLFIMLADSEGRTPLHWAVDRGHLKITEALVSRNADVNAKVIIFIAVTVLLVFTL